MSDPRPLAAELEEFVRRLPADAVPPAALGSGFDFRYWVFRIGQIEGFDRLAEAAGRVVAGRYQLDPREVATWLVWRTVAVPGAVAIREAEEALAKGTATVDLVLLIAGPLLREPVEIPGGVTLMRFEDLPESFEKREFETRRHPGPWTMADHLIGPTAAIMKTVEVPIAPSRGLPYHFVSEWDLYDFALSVEAMTGFRAAEVVSWQRTRPEFPAMGNRPWSRGIDTIHATSGQPVTLAELERPIRLFVALTKRGEDLRGWLRLVMARLARSRAVEAETSKAIELGVALEALLLADDDQGELRFRLAMNGAWLLEPTNPKARVDVERTLSLLYKLRSESVHGGRIDERAWRKKSPPSLEVIRSAQSICARALLTIAEAGSAPDWGALRVGGPGWDGTQGGAGEDEAQGV